MITVVTPLGTPVEPHSDFASQQWLHIGSPQVPTGWLWVGGYILAETPQGPRFYFDQEAAEWLAKAYRYAFEDPPAEFQDFAQQLNGSFALAYIENTAEDSQKPTVHLLADRCAGFPLYYSSHQNQLWLSTKALELGKQTTASLNIPAALSLTASEWVPGRQTLANGVSQIKPGEWLQLNTQGQLAQSKITWQAGFSDQANLDLAESAEVLLTALESVADRWSSALLALLKPGEKIGLPLSGGLDSRLLLGLFAPRLGSRLVALCYGNPASEDAQLSRRAAESIGVNHRQVPFLDANFLSPERQQLLAHSIGSTTRLTLGDGGLALAEAYGVGTGLKEANIAVVLPGHSGDIITGSRLNQQRSLQTHQQIQLHLAKIYQNGMNAATYANLLNPQHQRFAHAHETLFAETFEPLAQNSSSALLLRWLLNELVHRRVLTELPLYHRRCKALLPFFDTHLLEALSSLPQQALWDQTAYKQAARNMFSTKELLPLLKMPLQMRPPLVGSSVPPSVRRLQYALQRRLNPLAFERQYSSCPMMSLWLQSQDLRRNTLETITQSPTINRLFQPARLQAHLHKNLGKDWQLTTIGVWTLVTLALVGDDLEPR